MNMNEPKQPFAKAILGLLTETSLHAGTGQTVGVIDLPIQREAATDYPCVFGSSVKGAMRGWASRQEMKPDLINLIFGPEEDGTASEYASALAVSDARLLLLPVRSLTTHFKWVTCSAVLKRFQADCQRLGMSSLAFEMNEVLNNENSAWVATAQSQSKGLFLEEFRFNPVSSKLIDGLIPKIAQLMGRKEAVEMLTNQLVIIHDNMFRIICRFATPVNAHIRLNKETKTVETGALWYEETLPPETLMYTCLLASRGRKKQKEGAAPVLEATDILERTLTLFPEEAPYLQLGGNETVGMGWCKVTPFKSTETVQQT
jgi:CRISPR-associated protein Cmr4